LKIVIAVEQFNPNKGYLEYYLARELTKLGQKVYILTFGWSRNILRKIFEDGFEMVSLPYIGIINGLHIPNLAGIIYIVKFLRREKPDIIHCQPIFSPTNLLLIQLKDLFHYRCVGSILTGEFNLRNMIKKFLFKLSIATVRLVKNKIDYFFGLNKNVALYVSQTFSIPLEKIEIIPLGVDVELFKYNEAERISVRKRLGIGLDDVVICHTGRLIPAKQVEVIMESLRRLSTNFPKIKFLIIGDGDKKYLKYLKEHALRLHIENHVIFHPTVHRKYLPSFYSACDIAVWPAAPSISILEAAAVGLPVISGSKFFYEELEKYKMGYVIKRGNISELVQVLNQLVSDENLRKKISYNCRYLTTTKFNWNIIAKRYYNAYLKALYSKKEFNKDDS